MIVAVGSDHAGFELKELVKRYLLGSGFEVHDLGTSSTDSVDYPDFAKAVAFEVRDGHADLGILMCGTGVGVCITANKVKGIRAAAVWDPQIAKLARQHNDTNVLCLPGRDMEHSAALELAKAWINATFEGGRHRRRVEKIAELEQCSKAAGRD
jgi:ribose 5-phosphate isomerase B